VSEGGRRPCRARIVRGVLPRVPLPFPSLTTHSPHTTRQLLLLAAFAYTRPSTPSSIPDGFEPGSLATMKPSAVVHSTTTKPAAVAVDVAPGHHASLGGRHAPAASDDTFAVVIDAGSTGSRVHVFRFGHAGGDSNGAPELEDDTFEAVKPGLSAYAGDPAAAAASLKPLLQKALDTVPAHLHARTSLIVGATAGLRLLPGGQADAILDGVRALLKTDYPFSVDPAAGVTILDGADEGAFAWLTLNYLLGHLGKDPASTVAAIDLGGGSVQHAYALAPGTASAAPPGYVRALAAPGRAYDVYVHSYLGYGLMAARDAVLAAHGEKKGAEDGGDGGGHPCVPKAPCAADAAKKQAEDAAAAAAAAAAPPPPKKPASCAFKYGSRTHDLAAAAGDTPPDFGTCTALVAGIMPKSGCGAGRPPGQCSFKGAWQAPRPGHGGAAADQQQQHPARPSAVTYVSSYFWDRAVDAGLVTDAASVSTADLTPADLRAKGEAACAAPSAADVAALFPRVDPPLAPYMCLDLAYQYQLLTHGLGLGDGAPLTLVKSVSYRGKPVEAAWPLGAALDAMAAGAKGGSPAAQRAAAAAMPPQP
jgi:apyrase